MQGSAGAALHAGVDWTVADLILRKGTRQQVDSYSAFRENHGPEGERPPTGLAGSVTFFECNVMHGSSSNITPLPRSNVFVVYNSVHNTPVAPFCGLPPRPNFIAEREDFTPLPRA